MSTTISTHKPINIEDICLEVTCLECRSSYSVCMSTPHKVKNCRCGQGSFDIHVSSGNKKVIIDIEFVHKDQSRESIEPNEVNIGD